MIRSLRNALAMGLAVLLLLALAAPGLVGLYLAREHGRLLAGLELPGVERLEAVSFDRGWFTSRLRMRAVPTGCPAAGCQPVLLDSTVHHGPVPLAAPDVGGDGLSLVRGVVETEVALAPLFGDLRVQPRAPTLRLITRLALDGGIDARADLPASELRLAGGDGAARLTMAALSVRASAPAGGDLRVDAEWPDFSLVAERGGQIAFTELNAGLTASSGTWRDYQLGLDSLRVATAGGRGAALQGLRLDATDAAAGGSEIALRLSRLVARGNEYGPAILDGRVRLAHGGAGLPPLPALVLAAARGGSPANALRRTRPALRLNRILLGTPSGDLRGELALDFGGSGGGDEPAVLLPLLSGEAQLGVPVVMMENVTAAVMRHRYPDQPPPTPARVEQAINDWLVRGYIGYDEADNAYRIDAVLNGRDLFVNDRSLEDWPRLLERIEPAAARNDPSAGLGGNAGAP